jgi:hypothetical protein
MSPPEHRAETDFNRRGLQSETKEQGELNEISLGDC